MSDPKIVAENTRLRVGLVHLASIATGTHSEAQKYAAEALSDIVAQEKVSTADLSAAELDALNALVGPHTEGSRLKRPGDVAVPPELLMRLVSRLADLMRERHTLRHQVETLTPIAARSTAAESRVRELEGALAKYRTAVDWGAACGRHYLRVLDVAVAMEGDPCREGTFPGPRWTGESIIEVAARYAALSPRTVAADAQKETGR